MLWRMFRPALLMICTALAACGGQRAEPETASGPKVDPGKQCLDDARASHPKMPNEPDKIEVSYILVRSTESRGADSSITRTPEQACLRALEALDALNKGSSFADAVEKFSDAKDEAKGATKGAAKKGATKAGLGMIGRDDVDPHFADAAFGLDINEFSYVVETDAGYHIILRTK
jgi:NIMA-interacting peptidyl-prolyl cis-trans isomerase 1